jgi:hypothetical protein
LMPAAFSVQVGWGHLKLLPLCIYTLDLVATIENASYENLWKMILDDGVSSIWTQAQLLKAVEECWKSEV